MRRKLVPVDMLMFDFDGTLVNSSRSIVASGNFVREQFGLPPKPQAEILAFVGGGLSVLIGRAIETDDVKAVERGMALYREHYAKVSFRHTVLYDGVREALSLFSAKKRAIVSNKQSASIRQSLQHLGAEHFFDVIHGGDDPALLKPDAGAVLSVLRPFGIVPERAIMIGDMRYDVEVGKNARVHTCCVTYGFSSRPELLSFGPDFIIDDLRELSTIIK